MAKFLPEEKGNRKIQLGVVHFIYLVELLQTDSQLMAFIYIIQAVLIFALMQPL